MRKHTWDFTILDWFYIEYYKRDCHMQLFTLIPNLSTKYDVIIYMIEKTCLTFYYVRLTLHRILKKRLSYVTFYADQESGLYIWRHNLYRLDNMHKILFSYIDFTWNKTYEHTNVQWKWLWYILAILSKNCWVPEKNTWEYVSIN